MAHIVSLDLVEHILISDTAFNYFVQKVTSKLKAVKYGQVLVGQCIFLKWVAEKDKVFWLKVVKGNET